MTTLVLGHRPDGTIVGIDLDRFLATHALVQGNSGAGKSYTLRRIVECAAGKVQIIVLDPEGEYMSLREKFDFLLASRHGGDAVLSIPTAAHSARRLMELNVSTICDLSDLKPKERVQWARLFIEGIMETPRALWHRVLFVIDEAHIFAPEEGRAESLDAVNDLAVRGRKRGFGVLATTLRVAALNKNTFAELKNVLVGRTVHPDDQDRAARSFGLATKRHREAFGDFDNTLRKFEPGQFIAMGPAISSDPIRVNVSKAITTHPDPSRASRAAYRPPPTPAKIRKLIHELTDLEAKAAEEVDAAKELVSLKAEVARLREVEARLKAAPPRTVVEAPPEIVHAVPAELGALTGALRTATDGLREALDPGNARTVLERIERQLAEVAGVSDALAGLTQTYSTAPATRGITAPPRRLPDAAPQTYRKPPVSPDAGDGTRLTEGERRVMTALAQCNGDATYRKAAALANYSRKASTWRSIMARLRKGGHIIEVGADRMSLTASGRAALGTWEPLPTGTALHTHWLQTLPACPAEFLAAFLRVYPQGLDRHALSRATGGRYSASASTMRSGLAKLRKLELIEDRDGLMYAARDLME